MINAISAKQLIYSVGTLIIASSLLTSNGQSQGGRQHRIVRPLVPEVA